MYRYRTSGTCSFAIEFDVKDGIVSDVTFFGGCRGNAQGIAKLSEGRPVSEVAALLKGIRCRNGTSCPDQLARALEALGAESDGGGGSGRLSFLPDTAGAEPERNSSAAEPDRGNAGGAPQSGSAATRSE